MLGENLNYISAIFITRAFYISTPGCMLFAIEYFNDSSDVRVIISKSFIYYKFI
jgi:hypothetical protein